MKINVTRRDVFRVAAGTAAGVMLTPAPWKLVDDLAIWTQNWSWIPVPSNGPVTTASTVCSLCPAGCGLEARCVSGIPVSLKGREHPICPLGQTGHHLPFHPARITCPVHVDHGPVRNPLRKVSLEQVLNAFRKKSESDVVAVLDTRPGRSMSAAWRRFIAGQPRGIYLPSPNREGASLATAESLLAAPPETIGYDTPNARTIVSFGAPLAEGWGASPVVNRLLDDDVRLIQIEPVWSRTAELADTWLPARPGTEAVVALAIANVLLAELRIGGETLAAASDRAAYESLVARFTPEVAAGITGLRARDISNAARTIAANLPAVVIAGEDPAGGRLGTESETAILGLNLLLGSGLTHRRPLPEPFDGKLAPALALATVPDRSIRRLIIDASAGDSAMPWPAIVRKLAADAVVIALSPFAAGTARRADYIVPTLPFLEAVQEIGTAETSPVATFTLSAAILPPAAGPIDPVAFLHAIGGSLEFSSLEELIAARTARIHAAGRGSVITFGDGSTKRIAEFESADAMRDALLEGGRWIDDPIEQPAPRAFSLLNGSGPELARQPAQHALTLMPRSTRDATASAAVSPVVSKLDQESALRRCGRTAAVNPETARKLGVRNGKKARLSTAMGAIAVTIATDAAVMPDVIELCVGPDAIARGEKGARHSLNALDLCPAAGDGVWRTTEAKLVVEG
jgi:anaerobic selenocysteine-containing dehydrogenase